MLHTWRVRGLALCQPSSNIVAASESINGMDTSYILLILVFVGSFIWPYCVCYYRYYSPFAPEKYKIQHQKWKEAMKRRKESKKASKLASKELAEARKSSRMNSRNSGSMSMINR